MKNVPSFTQLSSSPYLLVFQPPRVPQLAQELPVFLACLALQQALGVPPALALQWLYLEAQLLPRVLAPLGPLLFLSLLEHHEHPGIQQEMVRDKQIILIRHFNKLRNVLYNLDFL